MRKTKSAMRWRCSDELWAFVQPRLPVHVNTHRFGGGRPRRDDREAFDAVVFVLRTGCQWNALNATDSNGTDTTTLHTAEFDALGRRIEKVVSSSGDLDGTFRYWYNGQQLIEVRDGSNAVLIQAYYGTQYIDEPVALKLQHGYCTVSQDANYNVTTLTDLAGRVLERVFYTEYGQPIIESESYFGDYDGDGDLDATDLASADTLGACRGSSPTGSCSVLDTDQDGDVDGTDYTTLSGLINAAPTTNRVHHSRKSSPLGNIFLHQGLVYDAEIGTKDSRINNINDSQ